MIEDFVKKVNASLGKGATTQAQPVLKIWSDAARQAAAARRGGAHAGSISDIDNAENASTGAMHERAADWHKYVGENESEDASTRAAHKDAAKAHNRAANALQSNSPDAPYRSAQARISSIQAHSMHPYGQEQSGMKNLGNPATRQSVDAAVDRGEAEGPGSGGGKPRRR